MRYTWNGLNSVKREAVRNMYTQESNEVTSVSHVMAVHPLLDRFSFPLNAGPTVINDVTPSSVEKAVKRS